MAREAGVEKALKMTMTMTSVVTGGTVPPVAATPATKEKTAKAKGQRSEDMVRNNFPIRSEGIEQKLAKAAQGSTRRVLASFATFVFKMKSGSCFGPVPRASSGLVFSPTSDRRRKLEH